MKRYSIWQLEKQNKNAEKIDFFTQEKVYEERKSLLLPIFSKIKKKFLLGVYGFYDRADKLLSK